MTWVESISQEEKEAIKELRRRTINDVPPKLLEDESLFYRFCKARDFNVEDAEFMLRKHIIWREENEIDGILTDYKREDTAAKYLPFSAIGCDKDRSVITYIDYGGIDIKGILSSATKMDILKFGVYSVETALEQLKQQSIKLGKPLTNLTFIFNFENLTFGNATNKEGVVAMVAFCRILQDNYPERVKRVFFINASIYFSMLFNIVKHGLAASLMQRIRCFGSEGWKEVLLEVIDADVLPAFLGGNRTDPDGNPRCKTIIKFGEKVPEHYYRCNSEKKLSKSPLASKLIITRFSKEERSFAVEEAGSYLEWEFETKNKDIGFAVYFQEKFCNDSKFIEVVPKQRIETCYEPDKGFIKCDKPGTYIVTFDNSYSWIHSKELYYILKIKSPKDVNIHTN